MGCRFEVPPRSGSEHCPILRYSMEVCLAVVSKRLRTCCLHCLLKHLFWDGWEIELATLRPDCPTLECTDSRHVPVARGVAQSRHSGFLQGICVVQNLCVQELGVHGFTARHTEEPMRAWDTLQH